MNRRLAFVIALVVALVVTVVAVFLVLSTRSAAPEAARAVESARPKEDAEKAMENAEEAEREDAERKAAVKKEVAQKGLLELLGGARTFVVERNGAKRVSCDAACALEDDCGLRDAATCKTLSCEGDLRAVNRTDFCMGEAATCADAVLCTCDEACWKKGECTGDHAADKRCEASCNTLARQAPRAIFVENRCIIESKCRDLAACAVVMPEAEQPMPAHKKQDSLEELFKDGAPVDTGGLGLSAGDAGPAGR